MSQDAKMLKQKLEQLKQQMDDLINEFKDVFDAPWEFHLYRHHHFGNHSVRWRKKGLNGRGQTTVPYDDNNFSLHRQKHSGYVQQYFLKLENRRLDLNCDFSIAMSTMKAINLRQKARKTAKEQSYFSFNQLTAR